MYAEVVKLLERDLEKARELRNWTRPENNYEVISVPKLECFNPVTSDVVLPIGHPHGISMYFQKLVDVLEEALTSGEIPKEFLPKGCPRYLEDLAI